MLKAIVCQVEHSLDLSQLLTIQNYYSLFTKQTEIGFVAILVYVDDLIITSDNMLAINYAKQVPSSQFNMKDMGELSISWALKQIELIKKCFYLKRNMSRIYSLSMA